MHIFLCASDTDISDTTGMPTDRRSGERTKFSWWLRGERCSKKDFLLISPYGVKSWRSMTFRCFLNNFLWLFSFYSYQCCPRVSPMSSSSLQHFLLTGVGGHAKVLHAHGCKHRHAYIRVAETRNARPFWFVWDIVCIHYLQDPDLAYLLYFTWHLAHKAI